MLLKNRMSRVGIVLASLLLLLVLILGGALRIHTATAIGTDLTDIVDQAQEQTEPEYDPAAITPADTGSDLLLETEIIRSMRAVYTLMRTRSEPAEPVDQPQVEQPQTEVVPEQDPPPRPPANPPQPPPPPRPEEPDRTQNPDEPVGTDAQPAGGNEPRSGDPQLTSAFDSVNAQVGDWVAFHFVVLNSGRTEAVQVESNLPPFLRLERGTTSWGQFYPVLAENTAVIAIGTLFDEDVVNIHIVARVVKPAIEPTNVITATLYSESSSDRQDNNVAAIRVVGAAAPPAPATGIPSAEIADLVVTEGEAGQPLEVVLGSQPASDVTIEFLTDDQLMPISPTIFTPATWDTLQTVSVSAVDDAADEGTQTSTITYRVLSDDPTFNGVERPGLLVDIIDNDKPQVITTISPDAPGDPTLIEWSGIAMVEGVSGQPMQVVLGAQPAADVVIAFESDTQLAPIDPITFTPDTWNTPQTIFYTAVDDTILEGKHAGIVTYRISSEDAAYNGLPLSSQSVTILDNDMAPARATIMP